MLPNAVIHACKDAGGRLDALFWRFATSARDGLAKVA